MAKSWRGKRAGKRSQRRGKRVAKRAAMNNNDIHRAVIQVSGTLRPVQGLSVSNYVYAWFSPNPSLSLTPSPSIPLFNINEFTLNRNMYDQFRVKGVSVRMVPKYKTLEAAQALAAEGTALKMGSGIVYTVEDRDGSAPNSIVALKRYASVKAHSVFKTINRYYGVKYNKSNTWFDCQDPAGMLDVQRSIGLAGGITVYGESLPEYNGTIINDPWYDLEIKYFCEFKGKAQLQLSFDSETGDVVVGKQSAVPLLDFSPVTVITDANPSAGAIDASGALIE